MFKADVSIRRASELRNDAEIMAIAADELIDKEAYYHGTCYRAYALILSKPPNDAVNVVQLSDTEIAFEAVKGFLMQLFQSPNIVEYTELKKVYETSLRNHENNTDNEIINLKKNLRRKVEATVSGFTFMEVSKRVYIFPDSIELKDLVSRVVLLQKELNTLQSSSDEDKNLVMSAKIILDEVKELRDELPWPPQPADLNVEKFKLPPKLEILLQSLLSGKYASKDSQSCTSKIIIWPRFNLCYFKW